MMKKIIKEVIIQEAKYETSDGNLFTDKHDAEEHEERLYARHQMATLKSIIIPEVNRRWIPRGTAYYVNNIDDYAMLAKYEPIIHKARLENSEYGGCGWYVSYPYVAPWENGMELTLYHAGKFLLERQAELEAFEEAFQTPEQRELPH